MKIFITGRETAIAEKLMSKLDPSDHSVVAPAKRSFNITDPNHWRIQMKHHAPDVIVHIDDDSNIDALQNNSIDAFVKNSYPLASLTSAMPSGSTLIYLSSASVYGDRGRWIPDESDKKYQPKSNYAISKLVGECYAEKGVAAANGQLIILRPSWLFNTKNKHNLLDVVIDKIKRNVELEVYDDVVGMPMSTDSLVNFILSAVDQRSTIKEHNIIHLGSKTEVSMFEFAEHIKRISGSRSVVKRFGIDCKCGETTPRRELVSCDLAEKLFGPMPDWKDDVAKLFKV